MANSATEGCCCLHSCLGFVSLQNMFVFPLAFEWKINYMLSLFSEAYWPNWEPRKKNIYNFAGLMKCATVLSLLISPQAVWYNWIISQNFSVNGRTDYSSVQTKLENSLISWLSLVGLLILWLWLVCYRCASVFASCECSMWMKLVEDRWVISLLPLYQLLFFFPPHTKST